MALVQAETTPGTQTTAWYTTLAGTVTVDTGTLIDGNATIKLDTSSPAAQASATRNSVLADAGRRISRKFRFATLPAAGNFLFLIAIQNSSFTPVLQVGVDSAGKLVLRTATAGTIGAVGSTTLAVNTEYRVSISYIVTSSTNWSAKVYLGQAGDSPAYSGALELSRTNADATLGATVGVHLSAFMNASAGANITLNLTHTVIDDSTDAALPDIGDTRITAKLPTTTTTNNFDTTIGTGAVNERPVSTTNGKSHVNTTDVDQDYEIQAASAGDVDLTGATIVGYIPWVYSAVSSLTGTPTSKIIANGARTAQVVDPTAASTAQITTTVVTSATYPQNGNGKNIGLSSSTIAADTLLYDCGVVVVYTPSSGPATFTATTSFALALGLSATPLVQAITSTTLALALNLAPTAQATRQASSSFVLALALAPTAVQVAPASTTFALALGLAPTAIVAKPAVTTFALVLGLSATAQSIQPTTTAFALVLSLAPAAGSAATTTTFALALNLLPTALRVTPATTSFALILAPSATALQVSPASLTFALALGLTPTAVRLPLAQTSFALALSFAPAAVITIQTSVLFALILGLTPEAAISLLTILNTATSHFGSRAGENRQPEHPEPEPIPGFGGGVVHFR